MLKSTITECGQTTIPAEVRETLSQQIIDQRGLSEVFSAEAWRRIAVEKEHIAGIHLNVNKRETLEDSGDAFLVGAGLISRQYMVDSSEQMRTLDDLKTAVFASGRIDSNGRATEIG
jgi:bifunctional DNA-binding transcriptional regulator/antitoxin component of YhaV-PrlF toxin-antitoxin module